MVAVTFLIMGLTNPQIGTKLESVKREGVDIMIALDVSTSMLAEDLKPNRLERAKQFVSKLIDNMKSDRVGLIVFAGGAYLQMPLTVDYPAAKMFLGNINTDMMPTQGTAIGEAVNLAMKSFESGETKNKSLIIITDGEHHDEDAFDVAATAAAAGIIIHTVGIGTHKGAPIPIYRRGRQADYKKDKKGSIVLSKLNEAALKKLAVSSNGQYYFMTGGKEEIVEIMKQIASMEKKEFEERVFTDYDDKFQYFLGLALLFIILEFFISERKNKWLSSLNLFQDDKMHRA